MQSKSLDTQVKVDPATAQDRSLEYRNAMSRLGAAVNIITTDGPAGKGGFAATAVCSVSDNPPTLLFCLNKKSSTQHLLEKNKVACINTLAAEHEELSQVFGGQIVTSDRFQYGKWETLETRAPILNGALSSFDCIIRAIHDGGTHNIFICEVIAVAISEPTESLLYLNREYRQI